MKVVGADGAARVYLDTADWDYIERYPDAEDVRHLRHYASGGGAIFLVSLEHLIEVAGFTTGMASRLEAMQSFPATLWTGIGGDQLLKIEAYNFAARCLGLPTEREEVTAKWLLEQDAESLQRVVAAAGLVRSAHGIAAHAAVASASAIAPRSLRDLRTAARRHGWRGALRHVTAADASVGALPRFLREAAAFALVGMDRLSVRLGASSNTSRPDPQFDRLVGRVLPVHVRRSRSSMDCVLATWRDPAKRLELAPALALVAEHERCHPAPKNPKDQASFEMDRLHLAFAASVDVFTCDKRTEPPARKMMARAGIETAVIRTRRLREVVAAIERRRGR